MQLLRHGRGVYNHIDIGWYQLGIILIVNTYAFAF